MTGQKYNGVRNTSRKTWLAYYQLLKEWIVLIWTMIKAAFGDGVDVYQLIEAYYRSSNSKDTPRDFWVGLFHFVTVDEPEDIQAVLNNSIAIEKSRFYRFLRRGLGNGLITAPVSIWRKHRKLIFPLFSSRHMANYIDVFNSHSSELIGKLRGHCDTNKHFDLWSSISKTTLAMIWEVTNGKDVEIPESVQESLIETFVKMSEAFGLRIFRIWLHPDFMHNIYAYLTGYSKYFNFNEELSKQINEIQKEKFKEKMDIIKEHGEDAVKLPLFDQIRKLREEGAKLTDEELRDEWKTIIMGGSETNAITISFTLMMLAMHPEIQEKVYREIVELSGEDDKDATVEEVQQMTYLEQCVRETLRLFPPIYFIVRNATDTFRLNDKFTVQKDSHVIIPIFIMHRNPKIYPNPLQWNPDNFTQEKLESRHKYSFLAFSGGLRGCVGGKYAMLALRIVLIKILKNYRVDTDCTMDDIKLRSDVSLRNVNGYKIKIYSRRGKLQKPIQN